MGIFHDSAAHATKAILEASGAPTGEARQVIPRWVPSYLKRPVKRAVQNDAPALRWAVAPTCVDRMGPLG